MGVKGYLVYVPFENVASYEFGNNGAPDRATVATVPGNLAGPFEVHQTIQDPVGLAEALRSAVKAGALRKQEAIGHLIGTCAVSPEEASALMTGEEARRMALYGPCENCGTARDARPAPHGSNLTYVFYCPRCGEVSR